MPLRWKEAFHVSHSEEERNALMFHDFSSDNLEIDVALENKRLIFHHLRALELCVKRWME